MKMGQPCNSTLQQWVKQLTVLHGSKTAGLYLGCAGVVMFEVTQSVRPSTYQVVWYINISDSTAWRQLTAPAHI